MSRKARTSGIGIGPTTGATQRGVSNTCALDAQVSSVFNVGVTTLRVNPSQRAQRRAGEHEVVFV
jgi:hypothetical protein